MKRIHLILFFILYHFQSFSQVKFIQPYFKKVDEPIVYIGINNHFLIETAPNEKILTITSTEGKIQRISDSTFNFILKNASISGVHFSYTLYKNGKIQKKTTYPIAYLTATVPDISRIRLGTKTNGKISLAELKNCTKLGLDDKDFQYKLNYNILCEIHCKPIKSTEKFVINIRNGDLANNNDYQELLNKLSKGDKIRFDKIKAIGNNGKAKQLESVTFTIE